MITRIESDYKLTKVGPIIEPDESPYMNFKSYNPTMLPERNAKGKVIATKVYLRGMGMAALMAEGEYPAGLPEMKSRLIKATSSNGTDYQVDSQTVAMDGIGDDEIGGVEDPYAIYHPDDSSLPDSKKRVILTYTAFNNIYATPALAITDLHMSEITRHGSMVPWWDQVRWYNHPKWTKAARVLPNRMKNGNFGMYMGDWDIWYMESEDLINWINPQKVVSPEDLGIAGVNHLEMGPIIETDQSYILGIHGISKKPNKSISNEAFYFEYGLFMALADKDAPHKLVSVMTSPVLQATEEYEMGHFVDASLDFSSGGFAGFTKSSFEQRRQKARPDKAIFATTASPLPEGKILTPTGNIKVESTTVGIPYGAADVLTALAIGDKAEIEAILLKKSH